MISVLLISFVGGGFSLRFMMGRIGNLAGLVGKSLGGRV